MVTRFISKGKGRNRKSIPISPKKKGVSVRSVSLEPQAILKINKKTIKTLNTTGETANFSSSLNQLVISARLKRDSDKTTWKVVLEDPSVESGTRTHIITLGRQATEEDVRNQLLRMQENGRFMYHPQDLQSPNLHSIERKARDPAIFDKVQELRQSEFKFQPSTQKNLTTQGSIKFLVEDIQSEIPKKNVIGLAIDLEKSNVSEKLLEEQIKFLEKSAIDMYKFKRVGEIKPVRIKQADRDELHRRIGDRLLMQVSSLDSAPSPDFEKRGLTFRKLHQQDASEDEFFGFDKS